VPFSPWQRALRCGRRAFVIVLRRLRSHRTWLAQRLLGLSQQPNEDRFHDYRAWRYAFVQQRLGLGFRLGIVYFSIFSALVAVEEAAQGDPFGVRVIKHLIALFLMAVGQRELPRITTKQQQLRLFLLLSATISIVTNMPHYLGSAIPPDLKGWTLGFFSVAAIVPFHWRWHLVSHLAAYSHYSIINSLSGHGLAPQGVDAGQLLFDMGWVSLMATLVVALYERLSRTEFAIRKKLRMERQRSDQLLTNILPRSIADRLLRDPSQIADSFPEVTVLFADLVGFTPLSSGLQPIELVELLNRLFSAFDRLAEEHGLEKIKTIGDAYMAAAGLPEPNPHHARAAADMALAMQRAIVQLNQTSQYPLAIRVGLHSGPVVAGVIGLRKFAYDLWGDTVNVASRMEAHGEAGKIQVTQAVFDRLGGDAGPYHLLARGRIDIKGRGDMPVYWLVGKSD
jgi:class 3 adenylate cyclase